MKPDFENGGDFRSIKKQARTAAILYFLNALPAPFALLYVPSVLIVRGNAIATANNVRDSEALLRLGMAGELFSSTVVIFAVLAFYSLFTAVSGKHARAMQIGRASCRERGLGVGGVGGVKKRRIV